MSYRLNKPCIEEERAEFIIGHNHQAGRLIYETNEAIFALEANEIVIDGQIIIDPDYEEKQEQKRKEERNKEIDSKIKELQDYAMIELLNNNLSNVKVYQSVIEGLELARP